MKNVMRLASRVMLAGAALAIVALVAVQYERVVERNVALSHALSATRADISSLKLKERKQRRLIERLSDPHGAIPEIHDRLHVVAPHEELIYLKSATPAPQSKSGERR